MLIITRQFIAFGRITLAQRHYVSKRRTHTDEYIVEAQVSLRVLRRSWRTRIHSVIEPTVVYRAQHAVARRFPRVTVGDVLRLDLSFGDKGGRIHVTFDVKGIG